MNIENLKQGDEMLRACAEAELSEWTGDYRKTAQTALVGVVARFEAALVGRQVPSANQPIVREPSQPDTLPPDIALRRICPAAH